MINFQKKLEPDSTVESLYLYDIYFDINDSTELILSFFKSNPQISGVVILSNKNYVNIISRRMLLDIMSRPFSHELFLKKPIKNVVEEIIDKPLLISFDIRISEATMIALQRPLKLMYEPIVVEFSDFHYKILDIDDLLVAQSEVHISVVNQLRKSIKYVDALLDNSGEGFLTFKKDLLIEEKYSKECNLIFGREIKNEFFPSLVAPSDIKMQEFFQKILKSIFEKEEPRLVELYIPLLPSEFNINNRYITVKYKVITDFEDGINIKRFMVVLDNITDRKNLENKIEEERNHLRMVLNYILNQNSVMELIDSYKKFYNDNLISILNNKDSPNIKLNELFRIIHTFKGNFSQFDFVNLVKHLNDVETRISEFLRTERILNDRDLFFIFSNYNYASWLEADSLFLTKILEDDFSSHNKSFLQIDKELVFTINDIINILPSSKEKSDLQIEFHKIFLKSFKEMIFPYIKYIKQLSSKLNKPVKFEKIEGGDIFVCPENYKGFCNSLVHVFRNIMDHAIEPVEIREEFGKDADGSIKCVLMKEKSNIRLVISDDGCGIDIEKIKSAAVKKKIFSEKELTNMTLNEIYEIIFIDNFTTTENITELSGRGVGLSAVKNEVVKLGGQIRIESEINSGTTFTFSLPLIDN